MRILATRQFLEQARGEAERVRACVETLLRSAEPDSLGRAAPLGDGRLVGYVREPQQLSLWFCAGGRTAPAEAGAPPPLATMSRAELLGLGVPEPLVPRVQGASRLEELDALGLGAQVAEILRFRFLQQSQDLPLERGELSREARDLDHLVDFLRGRITDLLLRLDPAQSSIVDLPPGGPIVVRGVAGSGKTAVALQRIARLLRQADLLAPPRILLLAYNRSLSSAARELLCALRVRAAEVEIETFHQWCIDFLGLRARFVDGPARQGMIRAAVEEVRASERDSALWSHPLAFWEEELHRIKSRVWGGEDEYFKLQRHGARRPLDGKVRPLVWKAFQAYEGCLQRAGTLDWDDVARLALRRIQQLGPQAPRYHHVFVDEAQDLSPIALRVASALTGEGGNLFIAYDPAQSIYEKSFRWRDSGIALHGSRSFVLRSNYRNTREILELARPLLSAMQREGAGTDEGEPIDEPEAAVRRGSAPRVLTCGRGGEAEAVARDVHALLVHHKIPPQNIAVLCYPNTMRDKVFERLSQAQICCQKHDRQSTLRLSDASVKVLPLKSAKGLEFPVVYLVASGACFKPPRALEEAAEQQAWLGEMRRVFYMGMTRAMANLVLVYAKEDPPPFLPRK